MTYQLQTDSETNQINIIYDETTSYEDRIELLEELVGLMQELKSAHILLDVRRAVRPLTTEQELHFGTLLAERFHYFETSRIAIVSGRKNPHGLIQTEAFMDGFRNMVEFATRTEAQDWLDGRIR